ncbi:MAG TPA: glycerate kinase [Gaiellales bacterium]|nr:glycerate kinase [Gaiellales bacterium]
MRVVIAPDKLKGTYSADEAARALARGWGSRRQDDLRLLPLADGGEGTAAALLTARGGTWRAAPAHDARGRPVEARYADLGGGQAALDVAEACGMWRVADLAPDPLAATSLGAGELIGRAIADGGTRIVVGVGGTATTDGGAGLRRGLGSVPEGVSLVAALDVDNPLLGAAGAAAVYGPQKGASPQQVAELERRLAALQLASAGRPGAGAGGGIGAMLMELGAEAMPGAQLVLDEVGFDRALAGADLCITGEGRIDGQTLRGKVVSAVAHRCRSAGVTCIAVGGVVEPEAAAALAELGAGTLQQGDLEAAGAELAARLLRGGRL